MNATSGTDPRYALRDSQPSRWEPAAELSGSGGPDARPALRRDQAAVQRGRRAARDRVSLGRGARCGSATAAISCGATSRTTASCSGMKKPAPPASFASRRTTPTAIPATARGGSSPASTRGGGSPAPNMTARSPSFSTGSTASGSIRRTTSSSNRTVRSGSPIRLSGSSAITRATRRRRNCRPTSIGSTAGPVPPTVVAGDINGPNGLCFSPDEAKLYIVESRARPTRLIQRFRRGRGRHQARQRPRLRQRRRRNARTASAAMSRATSGAAGE